jgi:ribosomal protein S18 acetylase RimI-like enzyme
MEISPLQADDLEAFVDELWLPAQREMAAVSEHTIADDIRDDGLSYRRSRLANDEAVTFLARDGAELLGYVAAEVQTPPPVLQQVRECHVSELYVREDARRQGLGAALLERIETWAATQECEWVDLNVDAENHPARELYEAEGYDVMRHNLKKAVGSDRR